LPGNVEYIAELPHTAGFGVVLFDDFYVLPFDVKNALADHLKVLADAEDARSKLVIVATNRVGEASDLPTRERRGLTVLADTLDELVPA
jgi:hypothetical protein